MLPPANTGSRSPRCACTKACRRNTAVCNPTKPARSRRAQARNAGRGGRGGAAARPPQITDVSFRVNFIEISGPFTAPTPSRSHDSLECGSSFAATHAGLRAPHRRQSGAARLPASASTPREIDGLLASRVATTGSAAAPGRSRSASRCRPCWSRRTSSSASSAIRSPAPRRSRPPHQPHSNWPRGSPISCGAACRTTNCCAPPNRISCATRGARSPGAAHAEGPESRRALVENFGGQWLQFRRPRIVAARPVRFMEFNDYLRMSMKQETELFFEHILRDDRSILDFLDGRLHVPQRSAGAVLRHPRRQGPRVPQGRSDGHRTRRRPDARQRADRLVVCQAHLAGAARQMGSRESAERARAAAARRRAGPRRGRRRNRPCPCASRWRSIGPTRSAPPATRAWTRSASAWRTSTPSAAGATQDGKLPHRRLGHAARRQDLQRTRRAQGRSSLATATPSPQG